MTYFRLTYSYSNTYIHTYTDAQINLGRANYLMDTVMLDDSKSWDGVRAELASLYDAANCPETARLVRNE
jgi:hypothetical protein